MLSYDYVTILAECVYYIYIYVTKICNGSRISNILDNFIPNISALNSKRRLSIPNYGTPSAGRTTKLHHFKSLVQAFFSSLYRFIFTHILENTYTDTDVSTIGQYRLIILANIYWSGPNVEADIFSGTLWSWDYCGIPTEWESKSPFIT